MTIDGHDIKIIKIGKDTIEITIDGKDKINAMIFSAEEIQKIEDLKKIRLITNVKPKERPFLSNKESLKMYDDGNKYLSKVAKKFRGLI